MSGEGFSCWLGRERARRTENGPRGLLLAFVTGGSSAGREKLFSLRVLQLCSLESMNGQKWACSAGCSKNREQEVKEMGPSDFLLSSVSIVLCTQRKSAFCRQPGWSWVARK